jgi:FixJ family two-component response regulator
MRSAAHSSLPLPEVLAHIAAATDTETALKIASARGGTRVFIPARPTPDHWLTLLVGQARAAAICNALVAAQGGTDVLIPMGPDASQRRRWQRMKDLIDAQLPKRQIARACGVHERTVQAHRNGSRKTVEPLLRQNDLFDMK